MRLRAARPCGAGYDPGIAAVGTGQSAPVERCVFEIKVDGQVAYSKKASGRFPSDEEIRNTVKS